MSLLTPLLPTRRHSEPPAADTDAPPLVWHVGLSRAGMFPHNEASCPCEKAACGLAVPSADIVCDVHEGVREYRQFHTAAECMFPRQTWFDRPPRRKRRR